MPGYNHISNFDSQVKQSFTMIVFDTFDELMLHHDVCSLSFSEIHTWIKKSVKDTWKTQRTKEVDWEPSTSIPNVLHQDTTSLLAQGKEDIKSNTFWGWIRTATLHQFATAATTSSGLRFGRSSTLLNPYEVYFHMDSDSCLYLS